MDAPTDAMVDPALRFLLSRIDYERTTMVPYRAREYKLDRMRSLLDRLDNPQDRLRIVHIAGTKGKGSTAAMVASMATAAGYRTGAYTSPHLVRLEERIAIDGQPCDASTLAALVRTVRPIAEAMDRESWEDESSDKSPDSGTATDAAFQGPTYFELTTAIAMLHFAQQEVDLAVIEVGMGGRLDSTNVCRPICCAITSISLDHTLQLGDTLAKIAREKAGILKPGIPIVSGVSAAEPSAVIASVARDQDAPYLQIGSDFQCDYRSPGPAEFDAPTAWLDYHETIGPHPRTFRDLALRLLGRHQAENAAVALAILGQLEAHGFHVDETAVRRGLATTVCRARIEIVRTRPWVVVDAAHNPASIEALLAVLDELFPCGRRRLIFATTEGKDVRQMLEQLLRRFDQIVFTRYRNNPRSVPPERLRTTADQIAKELALPPEAHDWSVADSPQQAWHDLRDLADDTDMICVTGSFFIASELRQLAADDSTRTVDSEGGGP